MLGERRIGGFTHRVRSDFEVMAPPGTPSGADPQIVCSAIYLMRVGRRLSISARAVNVSSHGLLTTSWDDGHSLEERIADKLEAFRFVGTIHASTASEEGRRLIDDSALARIGRNRELSVHGRTHTIFPELSRQALAEEIHWPSKGCHVSEVSDTLVAPPRRRIDGQLAASLAGLLCRRNGGDHRRGRGPGKLFGADLPAVSTCPKEDHP
jgi:hypothetical protein